MKDNITSTPIYKIEDEYLSVLHGDQVCAKVYDVVDGKVHKMNPFDDGLKQAWNNEYKAEPLNSITDLYNIIRDLSKTENGYFIRGRREDEYSANSKRKDASLHEATPNDPYFQDVGNKWVVFDFDKLELPDEYNVLSPEAVDYVVKNQLSKQFHNVSYVYQFSNSAGLSYQGEYIKKGFNCHMFFYLNE